jgi:hypothetical protein
VVDTKLARETKGSTVLQICFYSELVATVQKRIPEFAYVVKPGSNFQREEFRIDMDRSRPDQCHNFSATRFD